MGVMQEPGDQALETDIFCPVDRDTLVSHGNGIVFTYNGDTPLAEDEAIFLLSIADDNALFTSSIFELDGMAPLRLDDLPSRWALHAVLFGPTGVVGFGQFTVAERLAPERSYPDGELQIALLEIHSDSGTTLSNVEEPFITMATIRDAGQCPAGDHVIAQHTGNPQLESAKVLRIVIVDDKAAVFAVKSPFDLVHQVGH